MSTKKPAKKDKEFNPLKNIKTEANSKSSKSSLDSYEAKDKEAVDQYAKMQREIKHMEGEADKLKNDILTDVKAHFAQRQMSGKAGNFKVLGEDETVTFICQNAGSTLKGEDYNNLVELAGKKAAEDLLEADPNLKFNPDFIANEANQKRVFAALGKAFSEDELAEMFLPTGYRTTDGAIEKAPNYAKNAAQLEKIYMLLKLKAYIKI